MLGYPDQALDWSRAALARVRQLASPFSLAHNLYHAARLHQYRRDVAAVREHAEEVIRVSEAQGFAFWLADGVKLRGWAMAEAGEPEAGLAEVRRGIEAYRRSGAVTGLPYDLALLAEAHARAGQVGEALEAVAEGLAIVAETRERNHEAELHRLRGELLLRQGDPAEAEASLARALATARELGARSLELRAATSLARLWGAQGKRAEGWRVLHSVHADFTEGLDTLDLVEAQALLAALRG
jgi:predicted ATPase